MWFGHLIVALILASFYDFEPEIVLICMIFSLLPNIDTIFIRLHIANEAFHCGPTHSIFFAIIFGLIVFLISKRKEYGNLAFLCYLFHCIGDLPTDRGVMLLYPISTKRFSLNLWKDTGFWGLSSIKGYYAQKWALIIEGILLFLLVVICVIKYRDKIKRKLYNLLR